MAYNIELESEIRTIVDRWKGITSKKMFGGTAHLLNGNMLVGVWRDFLIVRLSEEEFAKALKHPAAKQMDLTGKPMKGWLMVSEKSWKKPVELRRWIELAKKYVRTLPKK